MKVCHSIAEIGEAEKGAVVTIGNFDGVHIGHQEILTAAKNLAFRHKTKLLVMTFEPHPAAVLHADKKLDILSPKPIKQRLLDEAGVDCWLIVKTEPSLLSLSGPDFIEKFVTEPIAPVAMVEGEDFYFGSGRSGDVTLLEKLGSVNDFIVVVVPSKKIELGETVRVSSTMLRYMLSSGNVADAAVAMGRYYRLVGKIVKGRGRGSEIGYPTLNMQKCDQLIPAEGVYAGLVTIADSYNRAAQENEKLRAVFSIGQARTFGDEHPLLIEAHLLNDTGLDPTGKYLAMDFVEHIRKQHKFSSPEELAGQIAKDCKTAEKILNT